MKHSAAVFLLNDKVRAVACTFPGSDKQYVYKSFDISIQPGDFVVVENNMQNSCFGMCVVKVVDVHADIDFDDSSVKYKWIVSKIDKKTFDEVIEQEKQMIANIKKLQSDHQREQLRKALNLSATPSVQLTILGDYEAENKTRNNQKDTEIHDMCMDTNDV